MSNDPSRRATLVIPLALATLVACTDTDTTAPRLGRDVRLAQGVGGVWTVNTLADPGTGGCDDTECTLREAIAAAAAGDQIAFGLQGRILLTANQFVMETSLSIDGAGGITIDARDNSRVMHVTTGDQGIINEATATATITRSTIYGNASTTTPGRGAGLHNLGVMHLRSNTVAENISPSGVGGIYNAGTMSAITTLVISNNGNPECGGPNPIASLGYNLSTPDGSCPFTQSTDVLVDLALPYTTLFEVGLLDNGGPTPTLALEPGGLAEDKASCAGETTDQRGFARPVDNPLYSNAADGCDIGAYEIQLTPSQQVIVVSNAVTALAVPKGISTSLQSKLTNVQAAITAGDITGACSAPSAFINAVNAQAGKKKISSSDATTLVAMAHALRTSLGCA